MWIVYQDHEYFGATIISVENSTCAAIEKIKDLIRGMGTAASGRTDVDWIKWIEDMQRTITISDTTIYSKLGFCAQRIKRED